MKKVESLISRKEYVDKVSPVLKNEIIKAIENSKNNLPKGNKTVFQTWYTVISWFATILGIGLILLGVYFYYSMNSKTSISYSDNNYSYNSTSTSSSPLGMILVFIGIVILIAGLTMLFIKRNIMKKIDAIYRAAMDKKMIYKTVIESLPNFKQDNITSTISPNLLKYRYDIPSDATIVESSPLFFVKYKEKYGVEFQSARYHWTRSVKTKNGFSTKDYYRDSGYALIQTDPRENDFSFSMHGASFFSKWDKIELENKDFLKQTKFRSNNPLKSRMVFTPLAMEEIVKHEKGIKTRFTLNKEGDFALFTLATNKAHFIIDASKGQTNEETAQNYIDDIVDDFFDLYEVLGLILIPPFL